MQRQEESWYGLPLTHTRGTGREMASREESRTTRRRGSGKKQEAPVDGQFIQAEMAGAASPCAAQSTASVLQEGRSSWPGEDTDSMLWAGSWTVDARSAQQ